MFFLRRTVACFEKDDFSIIWWIRRFWFFCLDYLSLELEIFFFFRLISFYVFVCLIFKFFEFLFWNFYIWGFFIMWGEVGAFILLKSYLVCVFIVLGRILFFFGDWREIVCWWSE